MTGSSDDNVNAMVERLTGEGLAPLNQVILDLGLQMGSSRLVERCLRPDKRGVFLEAVKVGGTWFTSQPAVRRFLAACVRAHDRRDAGQEAAP